MDTKELIKKLGKIQSPQDRAGAQREIENIFRGVRNIAMGVLQIAKSASIIKSKGYYKEMGYDTFDFFCKDVFNLVGKTVNLYIRIDETIQKYPSLFPSSYVTQFSQNKLEAIISGINKIESSTWNPSKKMEKVTELFGKLKPELTQAEIQTVVNRITKHAQRYFN